VRMKDKIPLFNRFLLFLDENMPEITVLDLCNVISTLLFVALCIYLLFTGL
jgi:hypothetical protein